MRFSVIVFLVITGCSTPKAAVSSANSTVHGVETVALFPAKTDENRHDRKSRISEQCRKYNTDAATRAQLGIGTAQWWDNVLNNIDKVHEGISADELVDLIGMPTCCRIAELQSTALLCYSSNSPIGVDEHGYKKFRVIDITLAKDGTVAKIYDHTEIQLIEVLR